MTKGARGDLFAPRKGEVLWQSIPTPPPAPPWAMSCGRAPLPRWAAPNEFRHSTACSMPTGPMWTSPGLGPTRRFTNRLRACPVSCAGTRPRRRSTGPSATTSMTTNNWWAGPPKRFGGPISPLSSTPTGWRRTCPTCGSGPMTPLTSPTRTIGSWRRNCSPIGRIRPWRSSGATM